MKISCIQISPASYLVPRPPAVMSGVLSCGWYWWAVFFNQIAKDPVSYVRFEMEKKQTNPIGFGWDVFLDHQTDENFGKGMDPSGINHLGKFYHCRNFGRWNMEQGLWRILWPDSISLWYLEDGLLVDISGSLVHGDRVCPLSGVIPLPNGLNCL